MLLFQGYKIDTLYSICLLKNLNESVAWKHLKKSMTAFTWLTHKIAPTLKMLKERLFYFKSLDSVVVFFWISLQKVLNLIKFI